MAIRFLRKDGEEVLRQQAKPVTRFDHVLARLLDDMTESLYHYEGVGLAAPQIGISKQIVVIDTGESGLLELVNPKIVSRSEEEEVDFEGCLSFPGLYGEVSRAQRVTVAAQDRNGEHYEIEAEGLLARALQHEIDHLNGILFIDHAPRTFTAEELAATEEDDAPSSEEGNA